MTTCDHCDASIRLTAAFTCPVCDRWLCSPCWAIHVHGQIDGQQELVPDPRTTTEVPF